MDMVPLKAEARDTKLKAKYVRTAGKVPCVVYGASHKSESIACDSREITKVYTRAGESTLVELDIAGKKVPVLIHELSLDPFTGRISHVDFYAVDMSKEIEANVPVHFTGESIAVKDLGAIFVVARDHVTVRCLPKDLPHELIADIAGLKEFHDVITVATLKVPAGVTIEEAPDTVIAVAQEPREEEVIEAPVAVEGAVGAEGAAATAAGAPTAEGAAPGDAKADKAAGKEKK